MKLKLKLFHVFEMNSEKLYESSTSPWVSSPKSRELFIVHPQEQHLCVVLVVHMVSEYLELALRKTKNQVRHET